ncbi:SLBB domain-containing protein [Piscinibacter sp. HJYY11]|uniref:polysaccharide biosynthesis/export family protein n=1 Tax=Piscinibacter sp. HJYY11 TaxID=2801333 RepID=UPI001F490FCE|nr:SLBB domain-containing protein [Piscinibacter sp. HJYY11]
MPGGVGQRQPGRGAAAGQPEAGQGRARDGLQRQDDPTQRRVELTPARPSEFQRFVEAATGRQLPVFGASFFLDAGNRLASLDSLPVSSDYTVGPGDEVLIRAWGAIDVDYRAIVDRNGQVNLPKVGSFTVAGVRASELERHLRAQIGRLYTNFNLNVSLGQLRGVKVFVVGPARLPGVYTVSSQGTVLSAVVAAGGPGPNGSMRKVLLRRNGAVVSELDIYEFLVHGDKSKDVQLIAGDVVVFQPAGPRVALTGALDTPAIYELKSAQESLRDVLRYAGGTPVLTNPNKVLVERIEPARTPAARFVEEFKLDEAGLQRPMRDGDVLTLLPISPQFANAVTLKGPVAQPLRYAHHPGMRIRDLIPSKEALITPDFYRRKNLLVQALDEDEDVVEADADGRPVADGVAGARAGNGTTGGRTGRSAADRARRAEDRTVAERARKAPAALFEELNWDYAVVERLNPDLSTQVIPFNLGKAVLQGDAASNIELLAGDVVTVYSQKDIRVPVAKQTRLVSLEGEVGAPGVYQLLPGETLPQLIARAGGFTPQAYVYGLEFTREDTRRKQRENLTEAISRLEALAATQGARDAANRRDDSGDRSASVNAAATQAQMARLRRVEPNGRIALELRPDDNSVGALPEVPLEHADRISVPARPGFITVAGAVVNNNALLWKSGRTVGDYLNQAGLDEAAERSNMFVLRADGTVLHAGDRRGFLGFGGIESQPIQPGDAIVVPSQLDFETWGRALVRNLKDFSQIFYQFGLGAAAIQTLRKN